MYGGCGKFHKPGEAVPIHQGLFERLMQQAEVLAGQLGTPDTAQHGQVATRQKIHIGAILEGSRSVSKIYRAGRWL